MTQVLDLAHELIARRSVTPDDAGCQRLIAERLLPLGFEVEWLLVEDVSNVIITHGQGSPSLWFLGHTDVVPPGPEEAWTSPPFAPQVRNGVLYGRGACDMKGAVAAMVVALERFVAAHPQHQGQVGLLLTSDEEGVAEHGVRQVARTLQRRGLVPDHILVGEPSSQRQLGDTVRIGRRGSIAVTLRVPGIQGHTAFPETIDNPLHRLAPWLAELAARRWDEGYADAAGSFPPTTCQVSSARAGTGAVNVTPADAVLTISLRHNPNWTAASLRAEFQAMLARNGLVTFELDWRVSGEPFLSSAGPLRVAVAAAVRDVLEIEAELNTGGGTSDGRFMAPLGCEVVELGLLNTSIHKIDENTPVADLERLAGVYESVLHKVMAAT
jgi:succinyl-diaminopimelate desuccinylase